jgi:hypothetical protein
VDDLGGLREHRDCNRRHEKRSGEETEHSSHFAAPFSANLDLSSHEMRALAALDAIGRNMRAVGPRAGRDMAWERSDAVGEEQSCPA